MPDTGSTIRVWSITNFEQLYEFKAFGETARSLAYHPCYDGTAEAAVAKFQVKSIYYFSVASVASVAKYMYTEK